MQRITFFRRIRCGDLEAVIARIGLVNGGTQPRYGVYFRRPLESERDADDPFFAVDELLTVARLARMAHASLTVFGEEEK